MHLAQILEQGQRFLQFGKVAKNIFAVEFILSNLYNTCLQIDHVWGALYQYKKRRHEEQLGLTLPLT